MTSRLYYTDSYLTSFEARVTDRADGGRRLYLDRTAFYPTSGGQPHDLGTLAGAAVVDVVDEDARVAHLLAEPAADAELVRGEIDWRRRFDHMQQHTGQHLLSAILADLFGHQTVSVHFGAESSSLDLDIGAIDRERVVEAERRANEIIWENRPLAVSFEDAASAPPLRKAPAREGTLRIVSIEGVDRSACGGTHVRATGEIGALLVRSVERVRKQARLEFLCGARAIRRARADFEALTRIAHPLSASIDEAPALVLAQTEQLRELSSARRRLEGELAAYEARALHAAATPGAGGLRVTAVRRDAGTLEELKPLAQAYAALGGALFLGGVISPPALLVAASDDSGVDAGATMKRLLARTGGRGGGSPRLAQGSLPSAEALDQALEQLRRDPAGA